MDYQFDSLDLADDSEPARARQEGWLEAVQLGFHEGRTGDEMRDIWRRHVEVDQVVCRGAWLPAGAFGAGPLPVATCAWFDKTLHVGRATLPLRMITDVTTSPAHRRRGLVRRLMLDCLDDAVERNLPLAALTASEATIYGRWGFGPATFSQAVELDTGPRFGLRDFTDPGRIELVDPRDSWPLLREQLDRFHRASRGSVGLPDFYESYFTGAWNWQEGGPDKLLRGAVHLDADEQVDGVLLYRYAGKDGPKRTVKVVLLLATSPAVNLSLWQFLGGIDLVNHVTWELLSPHDPLRWALRDLNALHYGNQQEFLWVRVLDLPVALAARPWVADGSVVLGVADPQGHTEGSWRVTTRDGEADVAATDDEAELRLDAETLGSLLLGAVGPATLHDAGRIVGTPAAVARFAAMADLAEPPYNVLGF